MLTYIYTYNDSIFPVHNSRVFLIGIAVAKTNLFIIAAPVIVAVYQALRTGEPLDV